MEKADSEQISYTPSNEIALERMRSLVLALNLTPEAVASKRVRNDGQLFLMAKASLSKMRMELRRLVDNWFKSGPNLKKLFTTFPELQKRALSGRTLLSYDESGGGYLNWRPMIPNGGVQSWKDLALTHFINLIANPKWELLGGPCFRCGDYYLKKTMGQKAYCSRTCSARETATSAVKKKREQDRAHKVQRAQSFIDEYGKATRRLGCKDWVSIETGYTRGWLTRASNQGHLRLPKASGKRKYRLMDGQLSTNSQKLSLLTPIE